MPLRALDSRAIRPKAPRMPDAVYVRDAFARIADRYVLTNHVLSCGMDIWWRKVVTSRIRKWQPARLLDVASGTGDLALEIQDQCPDCEVIASDFCAEMLAHAASRGRRENHRRRCASTPLSRRRIRCRHRRLRPAQHGGLPRRAARNAPRPETRRPLVDPRFLAAARRPPRPYRLYLHHVLPRMAGFLTGQRDAYEYLGGSIEAFPSGTAMSDLLETCGFTETDATPLTCGVVSIYEGTRPPP